MKGVIEATRAVTALARKQLPPSMGFQAGWRPMLGYGNPLNKSQSVRAAISTYGGTEDSSTSVFACTTLIADTLAGYEWEITDFEGDELEPTDADAGLFNLLEEPYPGGTYSDFVADEETDICLVGNSFWLKDKLNLLGQPLGLERLMPTDTKIVTDKQDRKIGYTVRVNGVDIPFGLDEVIHYRTRNPLHKHYGMGIVEAIMRQLGMDLAVGQHLTGFFENGARIAGVLTVPDGMDDVQFERLKKQINDEYGGSANAYRTLIAEKATNFTPVQYPPQQLAVVDLAELSEDKVLKGFGVPEFLLGGKNQGGVYKMDQAQFIFYRRMIPRAKRFQDRTTLDLASRWEGRKFIVKPEMSEMPGDRVTIAAKSGEAGASLNEMRVAQGKEEIDDPRADEPLIPSTLLPFSVALKKALPPKPRPRSPQAPGQQPQIGDPAADQTTGSDTAPEDQLPEGEQQQGAKALEAGEDRTEDVAPMLAPRPSKTKSRVLPLPPGRQVAGLGAEVWAAYRKMLNGQARPVAALLEAGTNGDSPEAAVMVEAPELPHGYEQRAPLVDPGEATAGAAQAVLEGQARFFTSATPQIRNVMTDFFNEQRVRTIDRLKQFRSVTPKAARQFPHKKEVTGEGLWDDAAEHEVLLTTYFALVDDLGPEALAIANRIVSVNLMWDLENPYIAAGRDRLGEKVVKINETTRSAIAEVVDEGVRRGYTIQQIANGFADENFKGIQGVFDAATSVRAETIARSETAMLYNAAAGASYRAAGVEKVQVFDGTGDAGCADAAGQVWTLDYADGNPIEHPNCVRAFAPVAPATNPDAW